MIRIPGAWLDFFTLRRSIAWLAIIGGGYAWLLYRAARNDQPGRVLTLVPLVAFLLAPAVIGLFAGYVRWVDERTWAPWQGDYHAFDDHRIRVVEARDRPWFSSADVHAALGLACRPAALRALRVSECRRDAALGEVLSNEGLVALFGRSTDRQALRLVRWADGDVRRPWQKRRDAMRPAATSSAPTR